MAYQVRHRDPLLERDMQMALQQRGKELLGLLMIALGLMVAAMLWSYTPDDPSWLSATDAPARNLLGRFGATIASPLFVTIGIAAWAIAAILAGWGLRFFFHRGEEMFIGRMIFSPIAVALAAVFASTYAPGAGWQHSFGLGGLAGDTALAALLAMSPLDLLLSVKIISAALAAAFVGGSLFVLGFSRAEIASFGRFMLFGIIVSYASLAGMLGRMLRALLHMAVSHNPAFRARRVKSPTYPSVDDGGAADAASGRAGASVMTGGKGRRPTARDGDIPRSAGKPRISVFARRTAPKRIEVEPELVTHEPPETEITAPADDRVRSRIIDAIRKRTAAHEARATTPRPEPLIATPGRRPAGVEAPDSPIDTAKGGASATTTFVPPTPEPKAVVRHAPKRPVRNSRKAAEEAQPSLAFDERMPEYEFPPLGLLSNPAGVERQTLSDAALAENARMLENVLEDYGVRGEIVSVSPGPVVTMYELEPAPGLKASRVIGLADDIARSMSALSARVSTVPGRSVIGIELPNAYREKVLLREILSARDFGDTTQKLPLALGKNISGEPVVVSLAKMPHLLIAGTTGSGKSVAINTMILSLLYKLRPDECRLIMIDPKMLELSVYDGIPHLLSPVVTDPKKAVVALKWVVAEMEERYRKMSRMGVRNIDGYNGRVRDALAKGENFSRTVQTGFDDETGEPIFETEEFTPETMPYIVVVVDEMADLMMVAGKEIEACIQRLAQMARASGIHLIMATQRPSVDVITGTIKANFPTRISFQVTSKIDSRTILGEQGAEQLLGMGDMLFMAGGGRITRIHAPFVSDEEVEEVVNHLKSMGAPEYVSGVVEGPDGETGSEIDQVLGLGGNTNSQDALYDKAVAIVLKDRKCSTSYIQRKLAIGYNKAARLVEQMEESGLVSPANHVGKREILVPEGG